MAWRGSQTVHLINGTLEAKDEEARKQLQAKLEQEEKKARRRSLHNIHFIGELYTHNMVCQE